MGGLFGGKKQEATPQQPVVPMPDPEGPETRKARDAAMLRARQRSGRASTILSGGQGGEYSSDTLGQR